MADQPEAQTVEVRGTDIDELRKHGEKLFRAHYDEVALNKDSMRLDLNWHAYYMLEEEGLLLSLAAWVGDEMVGYTVSHKYTHLHYKDVLVIENDVIFVQKSHRRGGLGLHLIRETKAMAGEQDGDHSEVLVLIHAKPGSVMCKVLEAEGFGVQDIIYSEFL